MSIVAFDTPLPLPVPTVSPPQPPVSVTSRISLKSASGKRMHPRVDLPLRVGFADGVIREARDWSMTGFSLPSDSFPAAEGSIHRVHLHVALAGCFVLVEADAKVIRVSGRSAQGFRFIGLSPEKARILAHFIQSGVEGEAAVIGGLPLAHGGGGGEDRPRRRDRLMRDAGQAVKLLVLAAVVAGGATFVLSRLLTVTTDYAAIAANLQRLHAPQSGYLLSERLSVGTHLRSGETIGTIHPVATPQGRLAAETQIAALQTDLEQQNRALDQAVAGFATFLQVSRTEQGEAVASRQMLEAQVEAADRAYRRVVDLRAKDVIGQQRIDEEQQALLTLQRSLSAARNVEEAARLKLANAEAGRFSSDGRSTQKSPADVRQEIETTNAAITRLKTMLAGLDSPMPITSPCDCTVTALGSTPGAFVQAGAPIADLARDGAGGAVTVDALVQNPRLNLVREGQDVTVYLANRTDGVPGRVVGINFNPGDTGRTGLPTSLRTLDDYGLMTVRLAEPIGQARVGLPASISAPITWSALSAGIPMVGWGRSLMETMGGREPAVAGPGTIPVGKAERLLQSRLRDPA